MSDPPVVHTASGALRGTSIDTAHGAVHRFAGIPFGLAPVGDRRFRAADPAPPWSGVRPAADFGPAPVQAMSGPFTGSVPGMAVTTVDEDCLTLNVWRPAESTAARPVMLWIYGGAFVVGASSSPTYDGGRLCAEQDVVIVSVNYRVGVLGFLDLRSLPDGGSADTNCGLHDQLLALQWVQRHIADFGGDPSHVTVFGESAGAGSIMHLLTVPGIESVVHRAIAQSPGIDFTQTADSSEVVARAFVTKAGASTVAELRRLPAARVLEIQEDVAAELLFEVGTMVFHPVVDDVFVTASPSVAMACGSAADVPLLVGYTADEMRLFLDPRADDLDDDGLTGWVESYLTHRIGGPPDAGVAADLVAAYGHALSSTTRTSGADRWAAIQTDGIIRQPVIRVAGTRHGAAPTFVYQFDWQSRHAERDLGAFHAIELPFVFDAFTVDGWASFVGADEGALALGRAMRSAWAEFAATGDPSCAALGTWPRFERDARSTMVLDARSHVVDDPLAAERTWWAELWDPSCRPAPVPS